MENKIRDLCRRYTTLNDEEVGKIIHVSEMLQSMADLAEADVFVDCLMDNGDAIVVAEAKPSGVPSLYPDSLIGMWVKKENEPAVVRSFRLGTSTRHMSAVTPGYASIIQIVEPIWHNDHVIGVLVREKHPEDDKRPGKKGSLSGKSYNTLVHLLDILGDDNMWLADYFDDGLLIIDHNDQILYRNKKAEEMFHNLGFVEDILGQDYKDVQLVGIEQQEESIDGNFYTETVIGHEVYAVRHITMNRQDIRFAVLIKDITREKERERELILKNVATREIYHRIKNDFQTIVSLLQLQIRRTDDKFAKDSLQECLNRMISMTSTYQHIAVSGIDEIMIKEIISGIRNNILNIHAEKRSKIRIVIEGDDFQINSAKASTLALILNELIQNAMKHAYDDESEGTIRIIVGTGNLSFQIRVIDDGKGFQKENVNKKSLGLSIVRSLVYDQLRGTMEIESGQNGTSVTIMF